MDVWDHDFSPIRAIWYHITRVIFSRLTAGFMLLAFLAAFPSFTTSAALEFTETQTGEITLVVSIAFCGISVLYIIVSGIYSKYSDKRFWIYRFTKAFYDLVFYDDRFIFFNVAMLITGIVMTTTGVTGSKRVVAVIGIMFLSLSVLYIVSVIIDCMICMKITTDDEDEGQNSFNEVDGQNNTNDVHRQNSVVEIHRRNSAPSRISVEHFTEINITAAERESETNFSIAPYDSVVPSTPIPEDIADLSDFISPPMSYADAMRQDQRQSEQSDPDLPSYEDAIRNYPHR